MTLTKQITYEVRDLNGSIKPNQSVSIELKISDSKPKYLIHRILTLQNAQKRQGTASCKTRSEVRGGGRKPWKQKGTGQARSGSSNSPLWNGGGVTFGPKPRIYQKKVNIKERQLALQTAIYNSKSKTIVVDNAFNQNNKIKTKECLISLNKFVQMQPTKKLLIIVDEPNNNLSLSLRNIPNTQLLYSNTLNLRDVLLAKNIIVTESALVKLISNLN
ncbi:MAG: 50S ribosomal protein L4 [Desulfuromonadaceae bacterium]|jgi:large subunit ribosomal protein L4